MNPHYSDVARRAGHRCEYCRAPEAIFNFPFEVEHIVPSGRGGADDSSNLALACRACNSFKGDAETGLDELTGIEVPLFHPRRDGWGEHFRLDPDTGAVTGVTACGRGTVHRLRMNDPVQLTARLVWMELGLYP
jgi:hypothetical protein